LMNMSDYTSTTNGLLLPAIFGLYQTVLTMLLRVDLN
jgi:hypothetical protein